MHYHRLQKRSARASSDAGVAPALVPNALAPPERGINERIKATRELVDTLEDLRPTRRVADLRYLAEYADDLLFALETIDESAWALEDDSEVASALERLTEHRDTLERLSELSGLADDVDELARAVRESRRYHDDIEWAAQELEDARGVGAVP